MKFNLLNSNCTNQPQILRHMNKSIALILIGLVLLFSGCVPIQTTSTYQSKRLAFDNFNYESMVGLVQVYPTSNNPNASLDYPVAKIGTKGMTLSFDLLEENYRYIQARYIHCNADWSQSTLADIQFLDSYNEFPINNYTYSSNTRIPYVQYTSVLPLPKIPGNYLIAVYNEGDEQDLLFVRRILVYEPQTTIDLNILRSDIVSKRQENQQLEFAINYRGISNPNPIQDFQVVLLQNHNWNTAIRGLQPTVTRMDQTYMEYQHFNGENNFSGLNEFRFFDIRTIDYRGINVSHIEKKPTGIEVFLQPDKSRGDLAYTQINEDINGNYFLENTDPGDVQSQSEYIEVFFNLKSEPIQGDVFISGFHTNWQSSPKNLMIYNTSTETYQGSLLLKQGYYNYLYWVRSDSEPPDLLEGSNFQTENNYEVLLYYRDPSKNYDQLVGYRKVSSGN